MSSEPCRHERDYTTAQAMRSYIDAAKIAGDAAIERDNALAAIKRVRALCDAWSDDYEQRDSTHDDRDDRADQLDTAASEIRAALDTP